MDKVQQALTHAAGPLLQWYDANKRDLPWRTTRDPYAVWISEIMLQQTRVAAVIPYYERWMRELPDVLALAGVDDERLMKLWQGLGYYSRARSLKKAAAMIITEYGGRFPDTYETLLTLPGVGEYTAAAVASIAFGQRVSAVDGNLLRVAARTGNIRENILDGKVKSAMRAALDEAVPADHPGEFNQAMMDLGATICLPNGVPRCEACPIAPFCEAQRLGVQTELPVREKKGKRRVEHMTVYLMLKDGKVALRKRGEGGLLSGLWEFPHVAGVLEEAEAGARLRDFQLTAVDWKKKIAAKHIFTHVEWHMTGYLLSVKGEGAASLHWADREELERLAVPSAFKKYLTECMEALRCE